MPGKRVSVAANLQPQGASQKTARGSGGPLVACARHWGSAAWVFEGLQQVEAGFGSLDPAWQTSWVDEVLGRALENFHSTSSTCLCIYTNFYVCNYT